MSSASAQAHSPEEIQRHVKVYVTVFVSLAILTGVTVAVSYMHLPVWPAVTVALAIASVKGFLVAGYFMHLVSERSLIYWVLGLVGVFLLVLLSLPVLTSGV